MPFDGSGVYSLPVGSTAVTGATALASTHNNPINDIASALSQTLLRSGVAPLTGNLNANSNRIIGLADAQDPGDAPRLDQVLALDAGDVQTITLADDGDVLVLESTDTGAAVGPVLSLHRNSASPADNDVLGGINFDGEDDGGTRTTYARVQASALDVTNATEDGDLRFGVVTAGTLADELVLTGASLAPATSDGLALGTSSAMFSDLFLASGAVVNFNNGDVTATHASNTLTFAGATTGYVFNDGPVTMNGGGTLGDGSGDTVVIKGTTVNAYSSGLLNNTSAGDWLSDLGAPGLSAANTFTGGTQSISGTPSALGMLYLNRADAAGGNAVVTFAAASNAVGNITFTDGGAPGVDGVQYNTTSDGRLKTDAAPIEDSGEIIDQLNPVRFTWRRSGARDFGFIAQELGAVVPGAVAPGSAEGPDEDGFRPWSMQHGRMEAIAFAELKSLRRRVAQLEGLTP